MLRQQLGETAGERELVADDLRRLQRDGPGVDRPRERFAAAVDDITAIGDQRRQSFPAARVVAERSEPENPEGDRPDQAQIDQHAEHQPLVHDRENLAALADESEPLGPGRDESGRRSVHRPGCRSLEILGACLSGSGASGSTFASRTGFVTGLAAAMAGLSTDFFGRGWAAARPGFPADVFGAGFAAVTGLSADFRPAARGNSAAGFTGTSRISVFRP